MIGSVCLNTEVSLLCVIFHNTSLFEVVKFLKKDDFYSSKHGLIFSFLVSHPNLIDAVDAIGKMRESGFFNKKQIDEKEIWDIIGSTGAEKNILIYADRLRSLSIKRRMMFNIKSLHNELSVENELTNEDIQARIECVQFKDVSDVVNGCVSIQDCWGSMVDYWDGLKTKSYPKSGFSGIDHYLRGFKPGEFIIIAAQSGFGKTTLALNIAINIAKQDDVLFFSLEISKESLISKITSCALGINYSKFLSGHFDGEEGNKIMGFQSSPIKDNFFCDTDKMTVKRIKNRIRFHISKREKTPIVFIDYIGLIEADENVEAKYRHAFIASVSTELKQISKEFNITIIAISQTNREGNKRADKTPLMSDLKESSRLENDADVIMFISKDDGNKDIMKLTVAKNRNGQTGQCNMFFDGRINKFSDWV